MRGRSVAAIILTASLLLLAVSANEQSPLPGSGPNPPAGTGLNPKGSQNGPLSADARVFLEAHNEVRRRHSQPPLTWDDNLARFAEWWASKQAAGDCKMIHSDKTKRNFSESLFWGSVPRFTIRDAVKAWADEAQFYDAKTLKCKDKEMCGHFTQMVWRNTTRLGCSRKVCANNGVFITCNYDPKGNYQNVNPFNGLIKPIAIPPPPSIQEIPTVPPPSPEAQYSMTMLPGGAYIMTAADIISAPPPPPSSPNKKAPLPTPNPKVGHGPRVPIPHGPVARVPVARAPVAPSLVAHGRGGRGGRGGLGGRVGRGGRSGHGGRGGHSGHGGHSGRGSCGGHGGRGSRGGHNGRSGLGIRNGLGIHNGRNGLDIRNGRGGLGIHNGRSGHGGRGGHNGRSGLGIRNGLGIHNGRGGIGIHNGRSGLGGRGSHNGLGSHGSRVGPGRHH